MQTPMGPRGYRSSKIQGPFFVPLDVFVIISVKNDIDKKRFSLSLLFKRIVQPFFTDMNPSSN